MNMKFAKVAVVVAVSMSAMMAFTACDETTAGAQGVAGVQGEPGANGKDGKDGKDGVSCTAKEISDGSGYTISCGGEYVGVLLNGKDGKKGDDGKDGASCSATILADSTGYALICDNKMVGTIKNGVNGLQGIQGIQGERGEKGQDGSSCTVVDTTDSKTERTGYKLLCADTLKGVVWNGLDGEQGDDGVSCTVKAVTDGYDVYCGGVKTGSLKNGKDGSNCTVMDTTDSKTERTGFKLLCADTLKGVVWNGFNDNGFLWKYSKTNPNEVYIGETVAYWAYWTDAVLSGTSGFDWTAPTGLMDSEPTSGFTGEQIEKLGGVGGNVILKVNEELGWNQVYVTLGCLNKEPCFESSEMRGLCIEYQSDFENTQVKIQYKDEDKNNFARPYVNIPSTKEKKTLNLLWTAFKKTPDWADVELSASDAIKVMTGIDVAVENANAAKSGELMVYKLGAYGSCE